MDLAARAYDTVGRGLAACGIGAVDPTGARAVARDDAAPVALAFVESINRHDVEAIADLLCEDHLFVDSEGSEVRGRQAMRRGWAGYFAIVPDYAVAVERTFVSGNTVVLLGRASGSYAPDGRLLEANRWSTPAAWRAEVADGRVAAWQVYADNGPIRRLMRRDGAGEEAR
jgi:ketosteroid isomerase-like protein